MLFRYAPCPLSSFLFLLFHLLILWGSFPTVTSTCTEFPKWDRTGGKSSGFMLQPRSEYRYIRSLRARLTPKQPIHTLGFQGMARRSLAFLVRTSFLSMTKVTDEHIQADATNSLVSQGGDNAWYQPESHHRYCDNSSAFHLVRLRCRTC